MRGGASVTRREGGLPVALAGLTGMVAMAIACRRVVRFFLPHDGTYLTWLYANSVYNRTVIAVNYIDDRFVRRGLGGTIALLLSRDWLTSVVLFVCVSALWLVVPIALLTRWRGRNSATLPVAFLAAVIVLSPQTFLAWSKDLARTDVLVGGFIAWSMVALVRGRINAAILLLLIGALVHETALIYGVPLLAVVTWRTRGASARADLTRAAVVLIVWTAVLNVATRLLAGPSEAVVRHMLNAGPAQTDPQLILSKELATYVFVSGLRGVRASICYNFPFEPTYPLNALVAVAVALVYARVLLLHRDLVAFAGAVLVPLAFMLVVATDTGRWVSLAVLNGWLLRMTTGETVTARRRDLAIGGALLVGLLWLGSTTYYFINSKVPGLAAAMGVAPMRPIDQWLPNCDPRWAEVLRPGGSSARTESRHR